MPYAQAANLAITQANSGLALQQQLEAQLRYVVSRAGVAEQTIERWLEEWDA